MANTSQVSQASEYIASFYSEFTDLKAYHDYYYRQTPEGKRYARLTFLWRQVIILFGGLVMFGAFRLSPGVQTSKALYITVSTFFMAELMLWWLTLRPATVYSERASKKAYQRLDKRETLQECRISPSGIEIRSELSLHRWAWDAIDNIVFSDEHIFLQLGCLVYIIPKRNFSGNVSFQAFGQALETFSKTYSNSAAISVYEPSRINRRRLILERILLILFFLSLCFIAGMDILFE